MQFPLYALHHRLMVHVFFRFVFRSDASYLFGMQHTYTSH
jgi:hypothetical protein